MTKDKEPKNDEIISSQSLHEQVNAERKREGKSSIPAVNSVGGASTGNLARNQNKWKKLLEDANCTLKKT